MIQAPLNSPGTILRELWKDGPVMMPGVFNPITALAAAKAGSLSLYITGAGVTNGSLGVPDIALITMNEMVEASTKICQAAPVPCVADADTGYGETLNVFRTVIEMERAGLAGIHLEDQVSPKRCGHLDGKAVIAPLEMAKKLRSAVAAKRDPNFVIIARTDARGVEGLDAAIDRANLYLDHGADAIFPEGLTSEAEFEAFRKGVRAPLMANMTEFGKTPLISVARFGDLGYEMVIFPMTAFRMMLKAVTECYETLLATGTQAPLLPEMKTRAELYEVLDYAGYTAADQGWADGAAPNE